MSTAPAAFPELTNYKVLRPLGEGAMGTVYLVRDLRLGREVALKLLPEALAADPDRRARFQREAALLAALQHAGIVSIYSVECDRGLDFFTMEVVAGTPLASLIGAGGLPLPRFFDLALQLTDALAAAHASGIIHRDLKPDNVMVTKDGRVKVLDFGVARRQPAGSGAVVPSTITHSPGTLDESLLTSDGHVVGTVAYMSPEQVEGKPFDSRSDLFSLGVLFHEMLTGSRPFQGDSWSGIMAAILRDAPRAVHELRPDLPTRLGQLVARLLAKNPERRYQSARDVGLDLEELSAPAPERVPALPAVRRGRTGLTLAAIVGAVLSLAAAQAYRREPRLPVVLRMRPITSTAGLELYPAISPDGKLLAYCSGQPLRLRVRLLDGGTSHAVAPDLPGEQIIPSWSPDSLHLAFEADATVWVVPALGGTPRKLQDQAWGPAWSHDGREIAYKWRESLFIMPAAGGKPRELPAGDRADPHALAWSPDGTQLLYGSGNAAFLRPLILGNRDVGPIVRLPAAGGTPTPLTEASSLNDSPVWAPDGSGFYFVSDRSGPLDIFFQPLARGTRPRGQPVRLTAGFSAHSLAISPDGGHLVASQAPTRSNIWSIRIPAPGEAPLTLDEATPVTFGAQSIETLAISPDGLSLAYDSDIAGSHDIYRVALAGGEPQRLTSDPAHEFAPSWSPDGTQLAHYTLRDGVRRLSIVGSDGREPRDVPLTGLINAFVPRWSPDGTGIVFHGGTTATGEGVLVLRTSDNGRTWTQPTRLTEGNFPSWSPDGTRFAIAEYDGATVTGTLSIVTPDGARSALLEKWAEIYPLWSPDGRTVYFSVIRGTRRGLWSIAAEGGEPRLLIRFTSRTLSAGRLEFATDGKRFYLPLREDQGDLWLLDLD